MEHDSLSVAPPTQLWHLSIPPSWVSAWLQLPEPNFCQCLLAIAVLQLTALVFCSAGTVLCRLWRPWSNRSGPSTSFGIGWYRLSALGLAECPEKQLEVSTSNVPECAVGTLLANNHAKYYAAVEHDCLHPMPIEEEAMRPEASGRYHDSTVHNPANLSSNKAVSRLRSS